jgi:integrase/recombinase XerC
MAQVLPPPVEAWLTHLQTQRRYSTHTLAGYRHDLQHLLHLANDIPLERLTHGHIRQFVACLHAGKLGPRSLARLIAAWRSFFKWWFLQTGLTDNPVAGIHPPKASRPLPKALSVEQTQALLDHPAVVNRHDPISLRDLAMLELFYSSGLRLAELIGLDWRYEHGPDYTSTAWLNLAEGEVIVVGKGNKRRTVPVGATAAKVLQPWLNVRPSFLKPNASNADSAALFLGVRGHRITPRVVQAQLAKLARAVGFPVHVHPHMLRHSFASHVLQSAQDLRAVQEMLGHANLATTQVYTRLDFQHLAQAYDQAHPRAGRKS